MLSVMCRKGSKRGAAVDVLELTTKPRYSRVMGMPALVRILTDIRTQHTHIVCPNSPPPATHTSTHTHTYTLLHYSLLEPAVDLDGDVLMRKTFVTGEEVTGFISNVCVCVCACYSYTHSETTI